MTIPRPLSPLAEYWLAPLPAGWTPFMLDPALVLRNRAKARERRGCSPASYRLKTEPVIHVKVRVQA